MYTSIELLNRISNYMMENGFEHIEIDQYRKVWTDGNSEICPYCFICRNDFVGLTPLNECDGLEPVKCYECKEVINLETDR